MNARRVTIALLCLLSAMACAAQTVVTAGSVNGVLNPTQFSGGDIGAQINTAWGSGHTVRVPSGVYSFSTTINHPGAGFKLECDAGAVLNYTGSGDAITLGLSSSGSNLNAGIDGNGGCLIQGGPSAQSAIHIYPSNHTFVRNLRITGFTNAGKGYGIYDTGGNSVEIDNMSIYGNRTGIFLTGMSQSTSNYAANAVHVADSEISGNAAWAIESDSGNCQCSQNLGNVFTSNVFEGNGLGDLRLNWEYGTSVTSNYFESPGIAVNIGETHNAWGVSVSHNYFTAGPTNPGRVTIGYGSFFNIEENAELGTTSLGCFVNVITGTNGVQGASLNKRGVGTNMVNDPNEWCSKGVGTTNP